MVVRHTVSLLLRFSAVLVDAVHGVRFRELATDAEISFQVRDNVCPFEKSGAAAFDVGNDAVALPVHDGTEGFVEAASQLPFGDESFVPERLGGDASPYPRTR